LVACRMLSTAISPHFFFCPLAEWNLLKDRELWPN